jgi:hypothetical protein
MQMLYKTILVLIGAALIGAGTLTSASAAEGVGGFGVGGGYPASFGGNYEERSGDCRLVAHRVMTRHGRRIRRVQVCR